MSIPRCAGIQNLFGDANIREHSRLRHVVSLLPFVGIAMVLINNTKVNNLYGDDVIEKVEYLEKGKQNFRWAQISTVLGIALVAFAFLAGALAKIPFLIAIGFQSIWLVSCIAHECLIRNGYYG